MSAASWRCLVLGTMVSFGGSLRAQLIAIHPDSLPLSDADRVELAGQVRDGRWLEAEAALFRHVGDKPDSADLRKALAAAHFRNDRYLQAAAEYVRVDRMEPLDPGSRFTLAAAFVALDRRHWARKELEALAVDYPRNPLYPHWLAGIYQHYQWFDRALVEARRAIELDPAFSSAHDRLGQCLEALGRPVEALRAYSEAARLAHVAGDTSPWPSYHRGSLLRQSGRFQEALHPLQTAAELAPSNAEVQHELGLTLDKLDRAEEALAALETAVHLEPENAKFHYALARVQRRIGDIEAARASLERFRKFSQSEKTSAP